MAIDVQRPTTEENENEKELGLQVPTALSLASVASAFPDKEVLTLTFIDGDPWEDARTHTRPSVLFVSHPMFDNMLSSVSSIC